MTDEEKRQLAAQWERTRGTFRGVWNELRVIIAQYGLELAITAAPKDTVDGQRIIRHVTAWVREAKESVEFEAELRRGSPPPFHLTRSAEVTREEFEKAKADIIAALDEKRPVGLYAVFYDGETRPVAAFVLEQDAERYAKKYSGGATWEIKHGQFVPDAPAPPSRRS